MTENKLLKDYLTFTIEKASNLTDFDLNQIIEIEKICKLSKWSEQDYQNESDSGTSVFLIARKIIQEQSKITEIVGFILFRVDNVSDTKKEADNLCKEADLLNFGVTEKFQKQGIGNSLFEKGRLLLSDSDVKSIWLEVRESNTPAIRFYQKKGFKGIQIRKNFYSQPVENALLMKLRL